MRHPLLRSLTLTLPWLVFALRAEAQWVANDPVQSYDKQANGVLFRLDHGTLKLEICSESIVHVVYTPTGSLTKQERNPVITKTTWAAVPFDVTASDRSITLSTSRLKVAVGKRDGSINYFDSTSRRPLLNDGSHLMTPTVSEGENSYKSQAVFKVYGSEEAFYGLGQHQAGVWNYRGESIDLSQDNTSIAVPMFLSTNGYGVYWNNNSVSKWNNRFVHYLFLSSEVADTIDYYFFYGPEFDKIIASYRELTGQAPLFGKWAYGFWQCKNKYASQEQILGVAKKYRDLHIPVDNIVQDWYWWTVTGEFKFNKNYPDPPKMVQTLHDEHFHLMVSTWPFFDPGSDTYNDMDQKGYFIAKTTVGGFHPKGAAVYDAFNPEARKYYWGLINDSLFKIGTDAWWMDTTEPETEGRQDNILTEKKVDAGKENGARVANLFSLETTEAVYQGQRAASDQKRVFILSRSAAAGIQRNAVTAWSGDVLSDFETYKRQIPAGLNFALSGVPYWTTDIGGFILGHPDDPKYRELFVRWFQFGTFCPIFRVHGTRSPDQNELWSYGPEAQQILTKFDRLRYRLMPYIYSMAWMVTDKSYTPMRPLVMDFRKDLQSQNIGDQYLFGPSILVNPVTEQGAVDRRVYLPPTTWYDFWTGATMEGPKLLTAPAPLDSLPLYVKAGSIIPLGPDMEYTTEKVADPLELRVYAGANADFTLYEDENDNYNYEKGAHATIPIHWDDAAHALSIGDRSGQFTGMLPTHRFRIVFVAVNHGGGIDLTAQPDQMVEYHGQAVTVKRD